MRANQPGDKPEIDDILKDSVDWFKDWVSQADKLLLVSLALLIIGLLGGVIVGIDCLGPLSLLGLALLGVWFLQRYDILPQVMKKEEVVEQWSILIAGGQGEAESVFEETQRLIEETKAPDIEMERREVASGFIRGVLGGERDFLLISNNTNSNLKPYRMYINARDYGNNLDVSWYVVHQPSAWLRVLGALLLVPGVNLFVLPIFLLFLVRRLTQGRQAGVLDLDLFDQQDLSASVACAHHCLRKAVENLMTGIGQDTSEVDWKSKGFLGIS